MPHSVQIDRGPQLAGLTVRQALHELYNIPNRQGFVAVPPVDLLVPVELHPNAESASAILERWQQAGTWQRLTLWYRLARKPLPPVTFHVSPREREAVMAQVADALPRPQPAVLEISRSEIAIRPDHPGITITQLTWDDVWRELEANQGIVEPPLATVRESPTTEELQRLRLEQQVAVFETRYDPTISGRAENIRLGAAAINGTLVPPGAIFSFNETVGPRTADRGYQPAPEIVDGDLVPGIGGGICQVSSTLHVAFLQTGLERIEAHNHSIPVGYLPLGWDAAVAWEILDLRFRNNTDGHILIQAEVAEPGRLRVRLFGANTVPALKIEATTVETIPPKTELVEDSSLAPDERLVVAAGRPAYVVDTYTTDATGNKTFSHRSRYRSSPQIIKVGS